MRLNKFLVEAKTKRGKQSLDELTNLNCWGCSLDEVSLLREMPKLEVLSLTVNELTTLEALAACKQLTKLFVRRNKISDIKELQHLQKLPNLEVLSIGENPFCEKLGENYRLAVLRLLPNLKTLDEIDVTSIEREEALSGKPFDRAQQSKHAKDECQESAKFKKTDGAANSGSENKMRSQFPADAPPPPADAARKCAVSRSQSVKSRSSVRAAPVPNSQAKHAPRSSSQNVPRRDSYQYIRTAEGAIAELLQVLDRNALINVRDKLDQRLRNNFYC